MNPNIFASIQVMKIYGKYLYISNVQFTMNGCQDKIVGSKNTWHAKKPKRNPARLLSHFANEKWAGLKIATVHIEKRRNTFRKAGSFMQFSLDEARHFYLTKVSKHGQTRVCHHFAWTQPKHELGKPRNFL